MRVSISMREASCFLTHPPPSPFPALRNMSSDDMILTNVTLYHSLATEGALWFPDLTLADPTLALPLLLGAANLLNIEVR